MDLKISGTVIQVLEEQSGTGKNGTWRKQEFILETPGEYPKKICITQWGDHIDQSNVRENDDLTAYIDIQSREYNGRWYTDVKAWKIEKERAGVPEMSDPPPPGGEEAPGNLPDLNDELPF